MPMPGGIFLTVLFVLTSIDPNFTYLSGKPSVGTAASVIWLWSRKLGASARANVLHSRQIFLHDNHRDVSGCITITSCLSHSFFSFLPLFAVLGGGALGMLVSYTETRTTKDVFPSLNGIFDSFCSFCKVESPIFGFLWQKPSFNLCIQKSLLLYWFGARVLFPKFVSPHTNS